MKKFISMLVIAVMLSMCLMTTAFAAGESINVSSASAKPGETVTITVSISGNTGFDYYTIGLNYDSSVLELTNTSVDGGITPGATAGSGIVSFATSATKIVTSDGTLFTATFLVKDSAAEGDYSVSAYVNEIGSVFGEEMYPTVGSGTVSVVVPHEHSWGEWEVTKEATCTEAGVETRTCACGEVETREIATKAHSWGEWKVTKEATCTAKGEETRECAYGHKETREIATKAHSWGEWKVTKEATCTEAGEKVRECAYGHKETEVIKATGHKFGEWKVTKEATCEEAGEAIRKCTCGETETKEIKATGHKFDEWEVVKAATCTEDGEQTRTCACGETETEVIKAEGHKYDWVVDKKATATEDGLKHQECSICGDKTNSTVIPATGEELDDVPQTNDITPYYMMGVVAMAVAAGVVLKRKNAR